MPRLCMMVAVAELVQLMACRYATCEKSTAPRATARISSMPRASCVTARSLERPSALAAAAARKSQQTVSSRTQTSQRGSMP